MLKSPIDIKKNLYAHDFFFFYLYHYFSKGIDILLVLYFWKSIKQKLLFWKNGKENSIFTGKYISYRKDWYSFSDRSFSTV